MVELKSYNPTIKLFYYFRFFFSFIYNYNNLLAFSLWFTLSSVIYEFVCCARNKEKTRSINII